MSEDTQQAMMKKLSSAAIINVDWRRNQNLISRNMIKKWALKESISIQNAAQQIKIIMRSKEIWVRIARNQKIRTCYNQAACSFL